MHQVVMARTALPDTLTAFPGGLMVTSKGKQLDFQLAVYLPEIRHSKSRTL